MYETYFAWNWLKLLVSKVFFLNFFSSIATTTKLWPTLFVVKVQKISIYRHLPKQQQYMKTKLFMAVICQEKRRRNRRKNILQYAIFKYNFYFSCFLHALVKERIIVNSWTGKVHTKLINSTIFYFHFSLSLSLGWWSVRKRK